MRARASTIVVALGLIVVAVGVVLAAPPSAEPARADHCEGHEEDGSGTGVGAGCNRRGGTTTTTGPGGGDRGGESNFDPAALCAEQAAGWADCVAVVSASGLEPNQICGYVIHPDQSQLTYYYPEADPATNVLLYNICPRDGGPYYTEDTQLAAIGEITPPPSPGEVAGDLWSAVSADLEEPELQTWPEPDEDVVRLVPTFVQVTNWQGRIEENDCDDVTGDVCVTLVAEPSLTYEPGEPRAPTVRCEDGGTAYDRPPGPSPGEQARRPGACAYGYRYRTGVDGRPDHWTAVVTVNWEVTWEGEGESGEIDVDPLSTELDRVVDEVSTVVVDDGG